MQGTQVWSLVQEAFTCYGATKPIHHATEPILWSPWVTATEACVPRAHALQWEKPLQWEAPELQLEKACVL